MTPFTNIHVAPSAPAELDQTSRLPRLRVLTNDPAREYAQRSGEVERLPDSIVALILCKKGFSKVQRNGIVVEGVTRKPLKYWSEHSLTIEEKAGSNEKVLWVVNRLQPDVIHILKPSGEYVESIPLDGKAKWFDPADMEKVLGAKRRSQNRTIDRVRALHAPDTEAAADAAIANDAAMKSVVHTFPARGRTGDKTLPHDRTVIKPGEERIEPQERAAALSERNGNGLTGSDSPGTRGQPLSRAEGHARSSARGSFQKADRIHEIQRHLDGARKNHEDRVTARSSAARFGAAARNAECRMPANETAATPMEIEEW